MCVSDAASSVTVAVQPGVSEAGRREGPPWEGHAGEILFTCDDAT